MGLGIRLCYTPMPELQWISVKHINLTRIYPGFQVVTLVLSITQNNLFLLLLTQDLSQWYYTTAVICKVIFLSRRTILLLLTQDPSQCTTTAVICISIYCVSDVTTIVIIACDSCPNSTGTMDWGHSLHDVTVARWPLSAAAPPLFPVSYSHVLLNQQL